MPDISIFAAFAAGLISFISPCVLPLVPAYISFMSGVSLQEMTMESSAKTRSKVVISSLVFIVGFSIIFVLLGASATYMGKLLLTKMHIIRKVAGVVIVIFGLHLMGVFKLKFLLYEKRFSGQQKQMSLISVLLIGMAFAFGWSPCLGPILSGILAIAATQENVGQGIFLLSMYSLGLGLPFFLTAIATDRFIGYFNRMKKHMRKIEIVSGVFLIIIGVLIFFDFFTVLSSYLNQWFPFLQKIG